MTAKEVTIQIPEGQDISPVAKVVQIASQYESKIYIEAEDKHINAKSIMGMMTLAFRMGDKMTISADGSDEETAIKDLEKYMCNL